MTFTEKTVLVTGATSGIGQATAEHFARLGARVLISGRDHDRGARVVAGIEASGGAARFLAAELAEPDEVLSLADRAGDVDVLVNNAAFVQPGPTVELDAPTVRRTLDINLLAPLLLTQRLAPAMLQRGGGAIINVSSYAARHAIPGLVGYGASKSGLDLLTKAWALEFGPVVRVNAVSPGPVRTPPADAMGEAFDEMARATPSGRAATPAEVANAIVFLASDQASYMNRAIVPVDGGMEAA